MTSATYTAGDSSIRCPRSPPEAPFPALSLHVQFQESPSVEWATVPNVVWK